MPYGDGRTGRQQGGGVTWAQQERERTSTHYADLAMTKGWWEYVRAAVDTLESDKSGLYVGLKAMVAEKIKAAGFRPNQRDAATWLDDERRKFEQQQLKRGR